ncbi:membrane protein [Mycobacterium phage Steamy]|uniref:Membrane protein n=1 Tax=Mycobacterium phage Steamy TaxID=2250309 RepID=A0A345L0P7_9CAUD|nr:site-specific recombination directionality factor RDF [Mycobacterium phage Steamy]AXH48849.1 membrane protein [Mycobacterium phage Steamy]
MTRIISALTLIAAVAVAIIVLASPPAHAGPLCEARGQTHIDRHGGLAKDSADHIARGELPTCDPNPEAKSDNSSGYDDKKSRYCRKKWYC